MNQVTGITIMTVVGIISILLVLFMGTARSQTEQVRNSYWCFDFYIGTTTVPATVCRPSQQLCQQTRERTRTGGNVPLSECRPR